MASLAGRLRGGRRLLEGFFKQSIVTELPAQPEAEMDRDKGKKQTGPRRSSARMA